MFISPDQGAGASTVPPAGDSAQTADYEVVRHILFGNLNVVQAIIKALHQLGYAEPNDWSQPISTSRPNEVMSILTKRIRLER